MDDLTPAKCASSSATPSSEPEASSPSAKNSGSTTGESAKSWPANDLYPNPSQSLSDSPELLSALSLIQRSLDTQESQRLSAEQREDNARSKAWAMTWGNPLWMAARKRQADVGKEPQWISEKAAGFDRKTEPAPPMIAIQVKQVFHDGTSDVKDITVGVASK